MLENRIKIEKRLSGHHWFAKIETLTYRSIQNPGGCKDRDTWIALETYVLAITANEGLENSYISAKIGMPSIMDTINLPDMGRMNGN
ncbi:hypothetical protein XM53_17910 [Roseovarius atlanticus]|uniref:Uncharacterized protein n=1 Tax=Roseovarius atlanticus TaxID=1641875 RepID=A0A0T5NQ82_9RHOB|nr:hypothetical protein [Roseovarius atlanticus]KRS11125.1 hypothetical protein XM53_17910 [Roseovarius atlanticus]